MDMDGSLFWLADWLSPGEAAESGKAPHLLAAEDFPQNQLSRSREAGSLSFFWHYN
jgi:hypothetical protein